MQKTSLPTNNVPNPFIQKHQADVIGVLQGCDRLRLQGTLRSLYHPAVMEYYLRKCGVLWKDFKPFVTGITLRVRQAAEGLAKELGRPMHYFCSSATSKESYARDIQQRDQLRSGLISVFSSVEPCRTWFVRGDRTTQRLQLQFTCTFIGCMSSWVFSVCACRPGFLFSSKSVCMDASGWRGRWTRRALPISGRTTVFPGLRMCLRLSG